MQAVDYARFGWRVFPCHSIEKGACTCGKENCSSPGKHPRTANGVNAATNDVAAVEAMFSQYPGSNIGLACGRDSDVVVIDIDAKKGGYEAFDEYETERREGSLPVSLVAVSGGGGRHLFYKYPDDNIGVKNRVNWLPGVDVRSDGGYVILAPGLHISGGKYTWVAWDAPMSMLPYDVAMDMRDSHNFGMSGEFSEKVKDAANILEGVPEGERDDTLFRWACRLRRQHATDADGGRAVVTTLVLAAADKSDFPREEALRKVDQAFKQKHTDDPSDWAVTVTRDDEVFALEHLTDMGNRNRFVKAYGADLRFVPELGWLAWSDRGWRRTPIQYVYKLAEDVPEIIRREAAEILDTKIKNQFRQWSMLTENRQRLYNLVALAEQHPDMLKRVDDFDANPLEIGCANGIVNLNTGEVRQFTRDDLLTKNTDVVYDPDASLPQWDSFLASTTNGDTELQRYLQEISGYTATGLNNLECFFILSGPPASGKSTFVDAIMGALGDYGATSQSETFMYRRGKDSPAQQLATLAGKRMVGMSEIREGDHFNEALIKQITGGDRVEARFLYHDPFNYTPQFKLWFATNHDPISNDVGMLRRIKRIRFTHSIPAENRDPQLKALVKSRDFGARAVLAWIVRGAMQYLKTMAIEEPLTITSSVATYRMEQDVLSTFLHDRVKIQPDEWTWATDLFVSWRNWCTVMNENPGKLSTFRAKIVERGFKSVISADNNREFFLGLSVSLLATVAGESWS